MPPVHGGGHAPNLGAYLKSLKSQPVESSIENFGIVLLKRKADKELEIMRRSYCSFVTSSCRKAKMDGYHESIGADSESGTEFVECWVMIRDEAKEGRIEDISDSASTSQIGSPRNEGFSDVGLPRVATFSSRPPLATSHTSYAAQYGVPVQQSMFNLLSAAPSPASTPPGTASPHGRSVVDIASLANKMASTTKDLKAEIINGIEEIIDELDQVDDQIASYAQEHIPEKEVILTHVAESYPNDHLTTHSTVTGKAEQDTDGDLDTETFLKPLSAAGITVTLITDAAVFAIMSRVNKVILATHAVIANGGLVAAAGARIIAKAAKFHRVPVMVVSGVYKLSPEYPF
ncbi:hypothetical protein DID88_006879 [Monilinia fructigena]|uniref:Translation initiation factor eIF2B subunit beta n=1 Tax=Monilinia fructigena TaxID=38457 RepID=A0A395IGN7_9HELO|nr:hypothetical protein DID88_006879 [Monilinia fructigena]